MKSEHLLFLSGLWLLNALVNRVLNMAWRRSNWRRKKNQLFEINRHQQRIKGLYRKAIYNDRLTTSKNRHLENVKFIRDKLRVCLSIKENTLPAMTSRNVRKVFSNRSNKNCTYSHTIQMESPPSTSTKTAPSQPSHLPERLYLIPRGIGRETVGFKRRYEGWGGGGGRRGRGKGF